MKKHTFLVVFLSLFAYSAKAVNPMEIINTIKDHVGNVIEAVKHAHIMGLKNSVIAMKRSKGPERSKAFQEAIAELITFEPLINSLFKFDSAGKGLVSDVLNQLGVGTASKALGQFATAFKGLDSIFANLFKVKD